MKKLLIISPHFPPVNAPDMQRIRMSLPYFEGHGWKPTVISVDHKYIDGFVENELNETIPQDIEIYKTKAFDSNITGFFGIKNIALRSVYQIYKKGCELLNSEKFDLIFFSTSNFHICTLGPIWKKKYNVPFIIDFQDPWYSLNGNGKNIHNLKYKLSNFLHKELEKFTVPASDGAISVSPAYINNLNARYNEFKLKPVAVINFGNSKVDFEILEKRKIKPFPLEENKINVVSAGALTPNFLPVIEAFFQSFLEMVGQRSNYRFYFIGTSYFKTDSGILTSLINTYKIQDIVTEYTDRIGYFQTLSTMKEADILFLPGSVDGDYNPSKICNAIMSETPIFSVFNEKSIVHELINSSKAGISVSFNKNSTEAIYEKIKPKMKDFERLNRKDEEIIYSTIKNYEARELTKTLCNFFDKVLNGK